MAREINTKQIVEDWKKELKTRIKKIDEKLILNIIQIGNDEASNKYISNKLKVAEELGIKADHIKLERDVSQKDLEWVIMRCNNSPTILQLPVPDHIDVDSAMLNLDYRVDVDGFTRIQKAMLVDGDEGALAPATALGVMRIIKSIEKSLRSRKVAIVNRSHLIGKPLIQLLLKENAFPVVLHSKVCRSSLESELLDSLIVITGCGKRNIFNSKHFQDGQILIDCSMNKVDGIKGVGDMNKEDILENLNVEIASGYGHTGLTTVTALMDNVIKVYENRLKGD